VVLVVEKVVAVVVERVVVGMASCFVSLMTTTTMIDCVVVENKSHSHSVYGSCPVHSYLSGIPCGVGLDVGVDCWVRMG